MTATPERKPRYRRPPSWEIHSATGVRVPGGTGASWWDSAGVTDPEPAAARPEPLPIFGADCTP